MKNFLKFCFFVNIIFLAVINVTACGSWTKYKINLNTIATLQGLPSLAANTQQQYSNINHSFYVKAANFKNRPLLETFEISYYKQDSSGIIKIDHNIQQAGIVYVKITADPNDLNWKGATPLILINLKHNLNTITAFTNMEAIRANNLQKYHDINVNLYNQAQEFINIPLALDSTIHYFRDKNSINNIDNEPQVAGDVWVEITATAYDDYWAGTSNRLTLILQPDDSSPRVNLNTIISLTGMPELALKSDQKNKNINLNIINKTEQFASHRLVAGFTVKYFQNKDITTDIDDNFQVAGDVWFEITAADNDPYWTGTSNRWQLTLVDERDDLKTISDLSGMDRIIVDPNATYQQINKNVINTADQLKVTPLTGNFTIRYFSDKFGNHRIDTYYQQIGTVYIIIIPDYSTSTKWKANKIPLALQIKMQ